MLNGRSGAKRHWARLVALLTLDVACWAADLVVLGTGGMLSPIPPEVATLLAHRRIGVEISSTVHLPAHFCVGIAANQLRAGLLLGHN